MFGADDADWAIYRKIVRLLLTPSPSPTDSLAQNTAAPSSDEEDDLASLAAVAQTNVIIRES